MTILKRLKNLWEISSLECEESILNTAHKHLKIIPMTKDEISLGQKKMAQIVMPKVEKDEDIKFEI
jgi:hypothetical protein